MKTPGLQRRKRKDGQALYWVAKAISKKADDYPTPTIRIHCDDAAEISRLCHRYTAELLEWLGTNGQPSARFDGTLKGLITLYRKVPESPYFAVKHNTRRMYDESLDLLERSVGDRQLARLNGGDFRRWYKKLREPRPLREGEDPATERPERMRRAFKAMQLLRIAVKFGVTEDIPECVRLATILDAMRFESPSTRSAFLTYAQSEAIIRKAIELGRPSVAIAQALQFELTLRQIDVIGAWEKTDGPSGGITDRGQRWSGGVLWSEIDGAGILRKKTTKTGQEAIHDTTAYPLVEQCLALIPPEARLGPIVKNETTGLPYRYRNFYQMWRAIARKAGVPDDVWNRDSRAGGVTEGTDAGVDLESMRHHANHANAATTALYSRRTLEKTRAVAVVRMAARNRNEP